MLPSSARVERLFDRRARSFDALTLPRDRREDGARRPRLTADVRLETGRVERRGNFAFGTEVTRLPAFRERLAARREVVEIVAQAGEFGPLAGDERPGVDDGPIRLDVVEGERRVVESLAFAFERLPRARIRRRSALGRRPSRVCLRASPYTERQRWYPCTLLGGV